MKPNIYSAFPIPKPNGKGIFNLFSWQTVGSLLGCSLKIELPHIGSYKSPVGRIFFLWCNLSDPIFLVFTVYILSIWQRNTLCALVLGCHWCRRATVVLVLGGPRGQCVGREGGSTGLWGASRPVPLGSCRPTSTPLIHEGVNTWVKTPRLTSQNTLVCGRRWNWVFLGGSGKMQLVSALSTLLASPKVPKSIGLHIQLFDRLFDKKCWEEAGKHCG